MKTIVKAAGRLQQQSLTLNQHQTAIHIKNTFNLMNTRQKKVPAITCS